VAWCAISGGFLHLFAARDAGLFAKYGLDVNASLIRGSDPTLAALQAGEIDFAYCAADATIPGMAAGIDAVLIGAPLVGLPYVLVAHPDIQSVQDLRGKTIGINRPGDLDERLNRAMVSFAGVQPDEVSYRSTGGQTERYQALLAGQIDAVTVTPPLEVQARKDGLHVVFDLGQLPIPFTYSALHANSKTIRERPDLVRRFVAAMAESVQYVETHKAESERALARELKLEDAESLESAYTAYAERFVNRGMDVPLRAVQESIDYARQQGTRIQRPRAEDIVDTRFTTELRESGFLQSLWGRPIPAPTPPP
jgi:NitT/TauT family transport system substrate-binding protein